MGLHSIVDEQIPFKISSLTKGPIALVTSKILFSDGRHMTSQIFHFDQMTPRILSKNASFAHSSRANASSFHFGFGVDWEHT